MRGGWLVLTLLLLCALAALGLRALPTAEPAVGKLLVAKPRATDPTFDRAVVLLLRRNERGTLGVILNRPTQPEGSRPPHEGDRFGGPVSGHRLALWRDGGLRWASVQEGLQIPSDALTFTGVAGWAPGQLEAEVAAGSWWVTSLDAAHVLGDPEELWWKASAAAD